MGVPNYPSKYGLRSVLTPRQAVDETVARRGSPAVEPPPSVIFTYSRRLLADAVARHEATPIEPSPVPVASMYMVETGRGQVGLVGGFGIGAPAATIVLEELIAWGVGHVFSIGGAGGLDQRLRPGDIVLCTGAVRDEGVSHHYAPSDEPAVPTPALTDRLDEALRRSGVIPRRGLTWTIDAPYRETIAEAHHYRDQGVLTVEMEAAAIFTVAAHHHVSVASAFFITDLVLESGWDTHFGHDEVIRARDLLIDATLESTACD